MNLNRTIIILIFFSLISSLSVVGQTDAEQLLIKMDKTVFAAKDKSSNIKMVMINLKTEKEKTKKAVMLQKGADTKLFRYTFPKSDSGIATLSLPNNEIYLYLPLFKKPKKITNLAEKNAFNNSDFSVSDMATKSYAENYTGELISTNEYTYAIDLKPKSEDSPYSHMVVHINKEYFYPEQFDYYDKKNQMVKKATYNYIKIQSFWISDEVAMEDLKKNHKTIIYMSDIKINQGLKDELFTLENLAGN
jgi:outer membrane lipoprotein-sorting protein